jgi:putative acetyltransferase
MTINIRHEWVSDREAVRAVNERAFGQPDESALIERLRAAGRISASLVAARDGQVVGHILFTPVTIESDGRSLPAIGLAPMAVLPEYQRQGIGSMLVRAGIEECRRLGHSRLVVLGHSAFYPRFGFVPASRFGVRSEYPVPDEAFMALELAPGAFSGCAGTARFAPEFAGAV